MRTRADDPEIQAIAAAAVEEAGGGDVAAELAAGVEASRIRPRLLTETLSLDGVLPFEVPVHGAHRRESIEILRGRYAARLAESLGDTKPRRVLDVGAGAGAFALWASIAWPDAWIDCYERDAALADVCRRNLPAGARMLTPEELQTLALPTYDLVRQTDATTLHAPVLHCRGVLLLDAVRR